MPARTAVQVIDDEHTPLLQQENTHISSTNNADVVASTCRRKLQLRTQLVAVVFVCVLSFNLHVSLAAETSIREDIICKAYYDRFDDDVLSKDSPDRDCTANVVQRELTLINQVYATLTQLPGFLLALPYGILGDRIGRRKVLFLSIAGIILCEAVKLFFTWQFDHFPLRAVWLASIFRLVGGGDAVAATMVLAMLADVYAEEDRTTIFARIAAVATASELLAPLIGSALMLKDPWIPVLLGFTLAVMGSLATLVLLPETLILRPLSDDNVPNAQITTKGQSFEFRDLGDRILETWELFRQYLFSLFAIKNAIFLLFGFFAASVGTLASGFELQFVHKRFGWSYAYAGSIMAVRPSVTLFVLLVIIPVFSKILIGGFGVTSSRKDLFLARISAALLTAGTLLLSISEVSWLAVLSFVILAFGNAFPIVGKSLLTSLGPHEMAATLLSAMNVCASLGAVTAGPLIAVSFDLGLKYGGIWASMPLFVITLLFALTLASVCIMEIPDKRKGDGEDEP